MEVELEPRVKPLGFKVKGMSRETATQKASNVLDSDLRTHWSTATNTKEWILLELDEPCLLSHLRIYNKSVLEWEISVGLRYKPETFVKVRPRCEAPRRDMIYPMNYTPCRYVRISCLRGNPIAIFFIQLIGISVTGLEPEFQPVVNHLLPHIISHKQDADDIHLQLLQDITNRLLVFLPQLEADLHCFPDAAEHKLRFLALLVGPCYPILHVVNEREAARSSSNISEFEVNKNSQTSASLTVSSNFEPRRSRSAPHFVSSTSSSAVFRPDVIFVLLRKAYKESDLGTVCRMACCVLHRLVDPITVQETSEVIPVLDEASKIEVSHPVHLYDYSSLFGEDFRMLDEHWDSSILSVLDIAAVEEGILHILYACASQPLLCCKLAESASDFWSALPLVQALLPALRPSVNSLGYQVDDSFSQWKQPFVHQALSQIVATSSSSLYRPLLHACAGYLSSYSPSHAKAACVLIDLCSGVLSPWTAQVIAKIDLTIELLEELLGTIQSAQHSPARARAALKYVVLALCGHMDEILGKYKEVKHKVLFLLEMLEPFLDPAIYALKSKIAFGDVSFTFMEKQEHNCVIALNVIRTAVQKPAILPSLESEWRRGSVAPSVILSILEPHMQLPPDIDLCRSPDVKDLEHEASAVSSLTSGLRYDGASSKSNSLDESDGKIDVTDSAVKTEMYEDVSLFFAPPELRNIVLRNVSSSPTEHNFISKQKDVYWEQKQVVEKKFSKIIQNGLVLEEVFATDYPSLQADFFQLVNFRDCEIRATEFQRLALDLHSNHEIAAEAHDAAIDALLLAAECYVNPTFMMSSKASSKVTDLLNVSGVKAPEISQQTKVSKRNKCDLETIALLERKRDKFVLQLLVEAAELDLKYQKNMSDVEFSSYYTEEVNDQVVQLSAVDLQSADAITLLRRNQGLLCKFLIERLKRKQHLMHEILLHCLVFFLHSATQLYCASEEVIDIIIASTEHLNEMLTSLFNQIKDGNVQLDPEKSCRIRQRWVLLQRLVIVSSGGDEGLGIVTVNNGVRYHNLISPSTWMQRISTFSSSPSPLVRFIGWMAISRNAKQYIKERLFLASDLSQLTYLLYIFADELAMVDNAVRKTYENGKSEQSRGKHDSSIGQGYENADQERGEQSFRVIYPALSKFFPNMKIQFEAFGEIILEAVGLQLKSLSPSVVPDILCWFSDLCSWDIFQNKQNFYRNCPDNLKGHVAKNAKAIILYILDAIIIEHMEAMVPEIPRVVQILVSLCKASYCDVSFLDLVMRLLKPIVSYSLHKASNEENTSDDDLCLSFESLCFDELFINVKGKRENQDNSEEKGCNRALAIFVLACIFPDFSFQRRREMLQSVTLWVDFTAFEPTTSFHDYLCAFQKVMESCKTLLTHTLRVLCVIPLQLPHSSDVSTGSLDDQNSGSHSWFLDDICQNSFDSEKEENNVLDVINQRNCYLSSEQIEDFCEDLESLINKLFPAIELCWNFHHQLAKKLTITSAQCFMYSRCLTLVAKKVQNVEENDGAQFPVHWRFSQEGLAGIITALQENRCWEVASVMVDCLLGLPHCFHLDSVTNTICSAIKRFSCGAPKIAWRLQPDRWLSLLFARGIHNHHQSEDPLVDLFCALLGHREPEQRLIALKHLGKLVGQDVNAETVVVSSEIHNKLIFPGTILSVPEPVLSHLVSGTWDRVALLASSDTSLTLRVRAMSLLVDYIPYAQRHHLQSFLVAADTVFHGLGKLAHPTCEGPLLRLSLALIAGACLHSSSEDIYLIPQNVWRNIETIGISKTEARHGNLEKKMCEVLCRLRNERDEDKEVLREVLTSNPTQQPDPDFGSTRESILQVLAGLSSVDSYCDIFSEKIDQEATELEEAEIELDLIQKESAFQESSKDSTKENQASVGDGSLQQIKDRIQSLDKAKLREDIVSRRQKKLLMRRARHKYLEEAVLREAELQQELDRERAAEVEKEIERQRLLEIERAKTRELRHNLDMEKERQTQRELQRELEQAESGIRSSRRDFSSSTHSSRPRERYRERENARAGSGGSARTTGGNMQPEISTSSSSMVGMPTIVLSGTRNFSGQPPTILQTRERPDEYGSSYEENLDGSKDSGDAGSVGDPDSVSAFDGQPGGFGSAPRHGSRGSRSRQVMDRKERDARHEGKWERKHS
ncbi:hypothetical protein HS088_TW04G01236 [Tripterygium wilfordii]|uniref:Uncharacterized protein n=1 Tax=Tripterygium wilfordii TaxID=458696 RepID=A0A7J7DSI2_TRIWF|nr:hypothetical protein HS088_TW04G01236 [Tripterygium wilfordii]